MEFLKKIFPFTISLSLSAILLVLPLVVSAQEFPNSCYLRHNLTGINSACGQGQTISIESNGTCCFVNALLNVRDWLFYILLTIAAIFIIVAGYYFVTASGNPEQVTKAKHLVLYALIGVLVAFMSLGLVNLIATIAGWKTSAPSPSSGYPI